MPILAAIGRVSGVSYLGKLYSTNGGETESYQINPSRSKSFLGLLNYYGKFLPHLSSTLAPLYKLLSKGQVWHWGREQEECSQVTTYI